MSIDHDTKLSTPAVVSRFETPVLDAQRVFRAVLDAFANPARPTTIDAVVPYSAIPPAVALVLLALVDIDTPLWLDPLLDASLATYLRFHTGVRVTSEPSAAAFAVVASPQGLEPISRFGQGTAQSPELSTTVIVIVDGIDGDAPATLDGPGFDQPRQLAPRGFDTATWQALATNHDAFPVGVDVLLAYESTVIGLPRSTRITHPTLTLQED
jgi:alpha-D-ribose 1-methylphosphonate 5-triphosphate synthase subunit PhnH